MECQNRSDKYIWSPHDAYFYKGLSELIVDIDRLIYLSLEKIRKDFVFINLNTDSLTEFINRDNEWLSAVKETGRIDCGQKVRSLSKLLVLQQQY